MVWEMINSSIPHKRRHTDEAETWPRQYAPHQRQWTIFGTWYQERKYKGGFCRCEASWKYFDAKVRL